MRRGGSGVDRRVRQGPRICTAIAVGALTLALVVAGCTGRSPSSPAPTVVASSQSETPTRPVSPGAPDTYTQVDPAMVAGINSAVQENLKRGRYTYLSLPDIPGATGLRTALQRDLKPQVQRFKELSPGTDQAPYPELGVTWQLIAASPAAIGVRLVTREVGNDDTFTGKVETGWWDPATERLRPARDLIRTGADREFFDRLAAAAAANPAIDQDRFTEQLQGEWESFDSIAFTTAGRLWIEFDRAQISSDDQPVGITIDAQGLLSDFGEAARLASTTPSDPGLGTGTSSGTPTLTPPSPSATKAAPTTKPPATGKVNCAKLKCVALTFDDGPVAGTTGLLNVLKAKGVHATFFMVGSNAAMHPSIVRRIVADGHVVGNHSWDHPQLTRLSADAIRRELTRTNASIVKGGAPQPTLVRPPFGATNSAVEKVAAELGMAQILWNVDPLDWKDRNTALVTKRVLGSTRTGSIVLSHDIHPTTRAAYAKIIDGLRAKGFTLVTVPELLGNKQQPGRKYFAR